MTNIKKMPYIRVGTTFYKKINQPLASGDSITRLVPWSISTLKQDETSEAISGIKKYDSFCTIPSHLEYKQEVGASVNRYEPFNHKPLIGECPKTLAFLKHIFGEQFEFGLDYIKLLLEKPTQLLPILCLVSDERNTGKTTFLNFMKAFFGANMTINTNEDFRSQFNADWTTKLIIGVDEVLLDKKEDSERIKSLSTSRTYKTEAKGVDKVESDFFGKFILCSNNEETFIKIDQGEIRYWVRHIPTLAQDNTNLLEELKAEIPYFLNYLIKRAYSTESKSRMWFTPVQIHTDALDKVIKNNKTYFEKEIVEIVLDEMLEFNLEEICFTNKDLLELLGNKINRFQLKTILQDRLGLKPNEVPSTYKKYFRIYLSDGSDAITHELRTGRYYTFKKKDFIQSM